MPAFGIDQRPRLGGKARLGGERLGFGVEPRTLVRQVSVQAIEGEAHHGGISGANGGDGEIEIQEAPGALGIGSFQIGLQTRFQMLDKALRQGIGCRRFLTEVSLYLAPTKC